jgi:hypothetical protein
MIITVGSIVYSKVSFLVDYGTDDPVYSTYTDANGITYIEFGDGISGRIPPNGQTIYAVYRYTTTAASLGNVGAGTITSIDGTALAYIPTVNNAAATTGGADYESTDSIRINAPKSLRSLNRAVSAEDYGNLALSVNGIAKAKAIGTAFSSIALYLAASGGAKTSTTVKSNVSSYFTGKTPPGTTLAIYDYSPAYGYLNATVAVLPQYNAENVKNSVQSALASLFNFDNVTFNDFITEGDLYSTIKSVDGVSYVTINDYEKLSTNFNQANGLFTQTGTVNNVVSASTAVIISAGTCGIMNNSIITLVNGLSTHAAVGKTITAVTQSGATATNTVTLSAVTTLAVSDVITVKGNNGTTPGSRDFVCGINEIPIYNSNYFTITTTGGAS